MWERQPGGGWKLAPGTGAGVVLPAGGEKSDVESKRAVLTGWTGQEMLVRPESPFMKLRMHYWGLAASHAVPLALLVAALHGSAGSSEPFGRDEREQATNDFRHNC